MTETDGLAVVYDGQLIDATYFSCSGGRTEAAVAVWGGEIPYLQSVPSPGEEDALRETETLTFTAEEFRDRITPARPDADLSGTPEAWFGTVRYTAGGGIGTLELGGASFTGTEPCRLLGLRSTDIEFSAGGRPDGHDARLRPPRRPEPIRRGGHGAGGQAL